jgi:toxin ParE1/3/4
MSRVFYRARAAADLREIRVYIAADNPAAADRLLDKLEKACATLAAFPASGQARPDLGKDLRYRPVENYVILYCIAEDGVDIVRIMHGARNFERF